MVLTIICLKRSNAVVPGNPFFIAAYRFLSNLKLLQGVAFGPISDLGQPDSMLMVAGFSINLLPIVMTAVNLVSSYLFTRGYPLKTKVQLFGMALFFSSVFI